MAKVKFVSNIPGPPRELSTAALAALGVESSKISVVAGTEIEVDPKVAEALVATGEFESVTVEAPSTAAGSPPPVTR